MNELLEQYKLLYNQLKSSPTVGEGGLTYAQELISIAKLSSPDVIVEIGFNRGSSALAFLLTNDHCSVYSIDHRKYNDVNESVEFLQNTFPNRFYYIETDSAFLLKKLPISSADFVYIDGDHSYECVIKDARSAEKLNPKYILFDDYSHGSHANDIHRAISEMNWIAERTECGLGLVTLKKEV